MRILLLIFLLASLVFAHDPTVPDTLYCNGDANDGMVRKGDPDFIDCVNATSGSNTLTNETTTLAPFWKDNGTTSDTLARYFWDSGDAGYISSWYTARFPSLPNVRIDSLYWSINFSAQVDSGYCGTDSLSVYAYSSSVAGSLLNTRFDDANTTAVSGKVRIGAGRKFAKLSAAAIDTFEVSLSKTSSGIRLAIKACADVNSDSLNGDGLEPNGTNYLVSGGFDTHNNATAANRPYVLVYWTELSTAVSIPDFFSQQPEFRKSTLGHWREGFR